MQEPIVFLPGLGCDARLFGPQIAELSAAHAVMVAPITHGERIEEIASNILGLLPERFALAGCSMGGIVAMEILRRAPERVSRIALIGTNPLAESPQSAAAYEPLIVVAKAGRVLDAAAEIVKPEALAAGPGRGEVLALLQDMVAALGADVFVRQVRALQRRRDYQSTLRRCKTPALLLCGAQDGLTPVKRHSFMAELIPYAKLHVIEGAGHLPMLEQPAATTEALRDWLKMPLVLR